MLENSFLSAILRELRPSFVRIFDNPLVTSTADGVALLALRIADPVRGPIELVPTGVAPEEFRPFCSET